MIPSSWHMSRMQKKIMYKRIHVKYFENIAESKYLRDNRTQSKVATPTA
jgi:hypothetical protein